MKRLYMLLPVLLLMLSVAFFARATCVPSDTGTAANDAITCDAANQPAGDVQGQDGNDTIYVGAGVVTANNISGGTTTNVAETGNDTIVNDGTITGQIVGDSFTGAGSGDDTIVNNGSAGYIQGDSSDGNGSGDDTIINNGTVNGSLVGDTGGLSDGSGDDLIANNGNVTGDIFGDAYLGVGSGDDTLINNGTVSSVYGDTQSGNGTGDDTITNNGTVNGAIFGDNYASTGSGNDTITNSGTVHDDIFAGGGNDTVIIQGNNAQVDGIINGGTGYDVLTFNLNTADPDELRSWAEQIAAANPSGGTLTLAGHTYTWVNFEELTRIVFALARINYAADPVAIFCSLQGGINTYAIVGQQGYFSLNVSAQAISNGLTAASSSGNNVQIATSGTSTVYALPSGEVQVNNPNGFSFRFIYQGYCGALPVAQPVTPTPVPVDDLPPNTIVNQRYGG